MKPIHDHNITYYLSLDEDSQKKFLCIEGDHSGFQGELQAGVYRCPLTPGNAAALRERLPWLRPQPLGLATSFGFGDRLGLATPGHITAVRGTGIAPIFAQQSVRENARTGRTPQGVLDDAMWALFEMDWRAPWGADADHVKEISDLPPFIEAGYTFYTIDPNVYVNGDAQADNVKYGRAILHAKSISDYLVAELGEGNFDLEVSVDETDTPTSVQEHYYIASELRRLGVPFVSLAPRFIGSFEKGVDYVGDIAEFDRELEKHTAVMHAIGGYKLSIHTGSDKFSIYPSIAERARNLVHVKTAGTSYLESLRVIATVDRPFFREILDFSRTRYETDRATYHVSGVLDKVPASRNLSDDELLSLFEQFDARQVLHVTFGSVLDEYGARLKDILKGNLGLYEQYLQIHFKRHLDPFLLSG